MTRGCEEKRVLNAIRQRDLPLPDSAQETLYDGDEPIAIVHFFYDPKIVIFGWLAALQGLCRYCRCGQAQTAQGKGLSHFGCYGPPDRFESGHARPVAWGCRGLAPLVDPPSPAS